MSRIRLIPLAAVLAVAGLTPVAPAQIIFSNGSGYVESNLNGTANPLNVPSIGATQSISVSSGPTVVNGATLNASAAFNSTVNATSAVINGVTAAGRSGTSTPVTFAYGLGAPNPPTGPSSYGYFTNFNVTQAGTYNFNLGWTTPTYSSSTAGPTNYAYSDFVGYLWDVSHNTVYALGAAKSTDGQFTVGPTLPDLTGTPAAGATQIQANLGANSLFLSTGQYQLYLQSQSYVQGTSGTQSVTTNTTAGLTFVAAAVPEPASLTVFGALSVGGLATMLRRRKA